jgi:hypothetical protein
MSTECEIYTKLFQYGQYLLQYDVSASLTTQLHVKTRLAWIRLLLRWDYMFTTTVLTLPQLIKVPVQCHNSAWPCMYVERYYYFMHSINCDPLIIQTFRGCLIRSCYCLRTASTCVITRCCACVFVLYVLCLVSNLHQVHSEDVLMGRKYRRKWHSSVNRAFLVTQLIEVSCRWCFIS